MTNREAIARHLQTVKRFTAPPISPIALDQSRMKYDDVIEIPSDQLERSRFHLFKPMYKDFHTDPHHQQWEKNIQQINADDLDKEMFNFDQDTKEIPQPAIFTDYIRKMRFRIFDFCFDFSMIISGILSKTSGRKTKSTNLIDSDKDR